MGVGQEGWKEEEEEEEEEEEGWIDMKPACMGHRSM